VRIRRIARADLPALTAMVLEFERLLVRMEGKRRRIDAAKIARALAAHGFGRNRFFDGLIATEKDEALGYILIHHGFSAQHHCGTIFVSDFYVRPTAQRKGTGRALFEAAGDIGRTRGAARMEWTVWDINAPAIAFYRSMGAEAMSDELLMGVSLTNARRRTTRSFGPMQR
jgi:GNAT superfamily N-acetyltransferase